MMCQPLNSFDLNILDRRFFSSIQSLQYKESPKLVDELLHAVEKLFEEYSIMKSKWYIFKFAIVHD